ncbi:hypothetical protein KI387_029345, partial [Taxus chinensis]
LARDALIGEGHHVLGGYMSPINDLQGKTGTPAEHRVKMCQLAVTDSPFVMVDPWEAMQTFPQKAFSVLSRVEKTIGASDYYPEEKIKVMLLCEANVLESFATTGTNSEQIEALHGEHGIVCISRDGNNVRKTIYDHDLLYENRVLSLMQNLINDKVNDGVRPDDAQSDVLMEIQVSLWIRRFLAFQDKTVIAERLSCFLVSSYIAAILCRHGQLVEKNEPVSSLMLHSVMSGHHGQHSGHGNKVKNTLRGDFYVNCNEDKDLVLGVPWLHSLGNFTQDHQIIESRLKLDGQEVVLPSMTHGIPQVATTKRRGRTFGRRQYIWATHNENMRLANNEDAIIEDDKFVDAKGFILHTNRGPLILGLRMKHKGFEEGTTQLRTAGRAKPRPSFGQPWRPVQQGNNIVGHPACWKRSKRLLLYCNMPAAWLKLLQSIAVDPQQEHTSQHPMKEEVTRLLHQLVVSSITTITDPRGQQGRVPTVLRTQQSFLHVFQMPIQH